MPRSQGDAAASRSRPVGQEDHSESEAIGEVFELSKVAAEIY